MEPLSRYTGPVFDLWDNNGVGTPARYGDLKTQEFWDWGRRIMDWRSVKVSHVMKKLVHILSIESQTLALAGFWRQHFSKITFWWHGIAFRFSGQATQTEVGNPRCSQPCGLNKLYKLVNTQEEFPLSLQEWEPLIISQMSYICCVSLGC